jgi:sulfite reductase beta subunit-like hemoprotein
MMMVRINDQAQQQVEAIMRRMGYMTHQHALQVMISSCSKNLLRNDEKAARKLHNI